MAVAEPKSDPAVEAFLGRGAEIHALAEGLYADIQALGEDSHAYSAAVAFALVQMAEAVVRRDDALAAGVLAMIATRYYDPKAMGGAESGAMAGKFLTASNRRDLLTAALRKAMGRYFALPKRKIGRNDPCWCGSGQKFKRCHGEAVRRVEAAV